MAKEEVKTEETAKKAGQIMWENGDIFVKGTEKPFIAKAAWYKIFAKKPLEEQDLKTRPTEKQTILAKSIGLRFNPAKVCKRQLEYALYSRLKQPMTKGDKEYMDKEGLNYTDKTTHVQAFQAKRKHQWEKAEATMSQNPASKASKDWADVLGIEYPENVTQLDLSKKINEVMKEPVTKEIAEEAQKLGIKVSDGDKNYRIKLAIAKKDNEITMAKEIEKTPELKKEKTVAKVNTKKRSAKQMPAKEQSKDKQKQRPARQ